MNQVEAGSMGCLLLVNNIKVSPLGAAAGVAVCWPVLGEAAGGNHRSFHQSLQYPPPNIWLHKSGHGRQGATLDILTLSI